MSSHHESIMNRPTSNQCSSNVNTQVVKQEFDDEPTSHESSSSRAPCQSGLKCEYDPDCGCKQCRFNANTNRTTGEIVLNQIKQEDEECDNKTKLIKTQFVIKCVKKEELEDGIEQDCGCEECIGVVSSQQSTKDSVTTEINHHDIEERAQAPSIEPELYDAQRDDISDCPTPDYLPPFFSEDDDKDEEEEEEEANRHTKVNDSYSRRSERVASKAQKMYREEHSESESDSNYEPTDDDISGEEDDIDDQDTELENNAEICESFLKSKRARVQTVEKKSNKKFKPSHSNDQPCENSSDEYDSEDIELNCKRGRGTPRIVTLRLNCSKCDETFKDIVSLNKHMRSRHEILYVHCLVPGCSTSFGHTVPLKQHHLTEHKDYTGKWPCQQCDSRWYVSHSKLVFHMWLVHQKGHFRCAFKGCRFESRTTRWSVLNHYKVHYDTVQCKFKGCGMIFPNQGKLNRHQRVHTGEKPYKCDQCEAAFTSKNTLDQHLAKVHQIGKILQYKCTWPACKCVSIHRANAARHVRTIHFKTGDKRDPAQFLVQIETTAKTVNKAKEKVHITLRLNCTEDGCHSHFPDKAQLTTHLFECHQIGKFRCMVRGCSVSFQNRKHSCAHKKEVHQKQKLFYCGKCKYSNKTYATLVIHMYYTHEEGHFRCAFPGCRYVSYTNRNDVQSHRSREHGK